MPTPAAGAAADAHPPFDCRKCGRTFRGQRADEEGWCAACRRELIHRSTRQAYLPAAAVAVAFLWLMWWSGLMESPLTAFWLALGGVLTFVAYKVARRVLFDVLRGRATGDRKG